MITTDSARLRLTGLTATALAVVGCASQSRFASLQSLPPGSTIELVVDVPSIAPAKIDSDGEAVGKGTAKGVAGGAGLGAVAGLAHSVYCGPLFLICAPAMALVGAGGGAIVGGLGGGVSGAIRGLPAEKAAALEAIVGATVSDLDVAQTIRGEFQRNNQHNWLVTDQPTIPQVTIAIEAIYIEQFGKNKLSLQTATSLIARYGANDNDVTKKILFNVTSERHHVDYWIEGEGANLKQAVAAGLAENMRQITAVLRRY